MNKQLISNIISFAQKTAQQLKEKGVGEGMTIIRPYDVKHPIKTYNEIQFYQDTKTQANKILKRDVWQLVFNGIKVSNFLNEISIPCECATGDLNLQELFKDAVLFFDAEIDNLNFK